MASFLDLFSVTDSDGAAVARYRLNYLGSTLSRQDSWIFGMVTEFVYLVFQLMVIPANALLGAVLDSGQWMDPLSDAYQRVTGPLFAVVPPWGLALLGVAVVSFTAFADQLRSTTGKLVDRPILDRVGTVFGLLVVVIVLSNNPFALLQRLLEVANGFSVGLASTISGNEGATLASTSQALVDATIRIPTLVLNYGRELSPACQTQWSEAMAAGQALPDSSGCFAPGSNEAGIGSLATAVLMLLLPALPMLVFCVVAAWKYLVHLTLSAWYLISIPWVAALAIFKRRGFDLLSRHIAKAGAHLAMAVVTSMMAAALPALCAGVASELLKLVTNPTASAFALMTALGIGFGVSAWAIIKVTSNHGALVRILHAETSTKLTAKLDYLPKSKGAAAADRREKARAAGTAASSSSSSSSSGGGARTAKVKGTALAADPVAATTPRDVPADANQEGSGQSSATEAAVAALSSPARSVADASTAAAAAAAAGAATVVIAAESAAPSPGNGGYFTRPGSSPVPDAVPTASDAVPDTDPGQEGPIVPGPTEAVTLTGGEGIAATATPAPVPEGPPGTALATPARTVPQTAPDAAPYDGQSGGWRGALAAVSEVVRTVRHRTLGVPDSAQSYPGMFLRDRLPGEEPIPGAVPHPIYAPPLQILPENASDTAEPVPPAAGTDPDDPVNDQQRFNRLRRAGRSAVQKGRDTFDRVRGREPAAAEFTAPQRDPASFICAQPDLLAGDALAAAIEDAAAVLAAAGQQTRTVIDPDSPLGGLQATSDPEERLRPSDSQGFGDPQ